MRGKRATVGMLLLLIGLVVVASFWLRTQQRQYALNRQLIAALIVKHDEQQALVLVNEGADPNTRYAPTPAPTLRQLWDQLLHHSSPPVKHGTTAWMMACGCYLYGDLYAPDALSNDDDFPCKQLEIRDAPQLIQAMLRHGLDANTKDWNGWTPLLWAVYSDRPKTVSILLEHGAEVNVKTRKGVPPLLLAIYSPEIEGLLLANGVDANAQDNDGTSGLLCAVEVCTSYHDSIYKDILRQMLAHGGNPNLPDKDGYTPLKCAQSSDRPDLVALLRQAGAKDKGK